MKGARFRYLCLIALAALITGCNDVYSERPLFSAEDARGAAPLRTGIWLERDPACQFDDSKPVPRWPKCADWVLIRSGQLLGLEAKRRAWTAYDYVLAGGNPRVLQVAAPDEQGASRTPTYYYLGLDPTRLDPGGRIVEYRQWQAQCGPPPPPSPPGQRQRSLTLDPLPGLTPGPDAEHPDDCLAQGPAGVRAAVKASPAWTSARIWRWVRAAER